MCKTDRNYTENQPDRYDKQAADTGWDPHVLNSQDGLLASEESLSTSLSVL